MGLLGGPTPRPASATPQRTSFLASERVQEVDDFLVQAQVSLDLGGDLGVQHGDVQAPGGGCGVLGGLMLTHPTLCEVHLQRQ